MALAHVQLDEDTLSLADDEEGKMAQQQDHWEAAVLPERGSARKAHDVSPTAHPGSVAGCIAVSINRTL